MLERMKNVLKNRKQDDKGFSLVELAVVIVIIGILVAIAVPIFGGIQESAKQANVDAAAANASAILAGTYASGDGFADADFSSLTGMTITNTGTDSLDDYCATATDADSRTFSKGPGC